MADRLKCPECGVTVKIENVPAHYERLHPKAKVPEKLAKESVHATQVARMEHRPQSTVAITPGGMRMIAVVAVIIAVILIVVIVNPFRPPGPQVGDVAPGFTVQSADTPGAVITLSSTRGYITLLELMDVDCEVCVGEAPILAQVAAHYATNSGVKFLSVSLIDWVAPADTSGTIQTFKTTHGTSWPYGMDTTGAVRAAYFPGSNGFGTPATYILDKAGKITAILKGHQPGGAADYEAAIDKALAG